MEEDVEKKVENLMKGKCKYCLQDIDELFRKTTNWKHPYCPVCKMMIGNLVPEQKAAFMVMVIEDGLRAQDVPDNSLKRTLNEWLQDPDNRRRAMRWQLMHKI